MTYSHSFGTSFSHSRRREGFSVPVPSNLKFDFQLFLIDLHIVIAASLICHGSPGISNKWRSTRALINAVNLSSVSADTLDETAVPRHGVRSVVAIKTRGYLALRIFEPT